MQIGGLHVCRRGRGGEERGCAELQKQVFHGGVVRVVSMVSQQGRAGRWQCSPGRPQTISAILETIDVLGLSIGRRRWGGGGGLEESVGGGKKLCFCISKRSLPAL